MGLPMSSLILLLFVLWGQDSAADRRLSTVEGESDYCCRPHNTHNSRIRLDIGKGCLHMDRWMCQYSFRGLTVHTDISPSVIYCALVSAISSPPHWKAHHPGPQGQTAIGCVWSST